MRKVSVWLTVFAAGVLSPLTAQARAAGSGIFAAALTAARSASAPPQAAQPQYKHPGEADAYTAFYNEKDPKKKVALGEDFLQKFPDTDFKGQTYFQLMSAYFSLNDGSKATAAAREVLKIDPDNLDALSLLSYIFPLTFKADDPRASEGLSQAAADARHGLEAIQKLHKPDNVPDQQFSAFVKTKRALFNSTVGFVALQKKDYPSAIASFKAAAEDSPGDVPTLYRLGLAYYYSTPHDYDHAVWYIARAVAVGKSANYPGVAEIEKELRRYYVNYHGNDAGLSDIVKQASATADPPEGFKVAPMEVPKKTGNPVIDGYNDMTFPLRLGGEKAEQAWKELKGQAVQLAGSIDSVEKGTDAGTYLVRIDILVSAKSTTGTFDIELTDKTQPNVKNLSPGDLVTFKGTVAAYKDTPSLVLSLDGEITQPDPLPDKPPAKAKPKPKPTPRRRTTRRRA